MIAFIYPLYTPLRTTRNYSVIGNLYALQITAAALSMSSLLSSPVVSWQRIYNSLTVTTAHTKSSLHSLIPFLPLLLNHFRLPSQETPPVLRAAPTENAVS
jgi:hypothetical protein